MRSLSFFNRGVKYFLYVIYVSTKYAWVKPLKDKKSKTVLPGFIQIVNKSKRQQNQLSIDRGRGFYNDLIQKWVAEVIKDS